MAFTQELGIQSVFVLSALFTVSQWCHATVKGNTLYSEIAVAVSEMIQTEYVRKVTLNDEISRKAYKNLFKALDGRKVYFDATDMASFEEYATKIDDEMRTGKLEFADKVFPLFKERLKQRVATFKKLIEAPEDFTTDETISLDYDTIPYAKNAQEIEQRLRKELKARLLSLKIAEPKLSVAERKKKIILSFDRILRSFDKMREMDFFEIYVTAVTNALDPHSDYLSPSSAEDLIMNMTLKLIGIGASLRENDEGLVEVMELIEGAPAKLDGKLKVGDKIIGVATEGTLDSMRDLMGLTLKEVVALIRGKAKTKVLLKVTSKTSPTAVIIPLIRAEIKVEDNRVVKRVVRAKSPQSAKTYKVGEIYLPSFYEDSEGCRVDPENCVSPGNDIRKILTGDPEFKDIDLLMLDLRNDGGGLLSTTPGLIGQFIKQGPVVQIKTTGKVIPLNDDVEKGPTYKGPLVVVVNQASASASEIVAAALQDYGRALLVGSPTFGKGTVQSVIPLDHSRFGIGKPKNTKGMLKLTESEFYRINGESTQELGATPNVLLPALTSVRYPRESDLPNALKHSKINPAEYTPVSKLSPELVKELQVRSDARRRLKKEFATLDKEIAEAKKRKDDKNLSLNEKTRIAEAKNSGEEDEDGDSTIADSVPLVLTRALKKAAEKKPLPTFYNDELVNIGIDFVELGKKK